MLGIATVKRIFSNQHQSSGVCRGAASLSVAQYLETQQLSAARWSWSWWAAFKKEQYKSLSKSCSSARTEYYHLVTGLWVCHFYLPLSKNTYKSFHCRSWTLVLYYDLTPPLSYLQSLFTKIQPAQDVKIRPSVELFYFASLQYLVKGRHLFPFYSTTSRQDSKFVSIFENKCEKTLDNPHYTQLLLQAECVLSYNPHEHNPETSQKFRKRRLVKNPLHAKAYRRESQKLRGPLLLHYSFAAWRGGAVHEHRV